MSRPRNTASALAIVWICVWSSWLIGMVQGDRFGLFATEWFMSVTMLVGSFIAGATSEGGGAVAFPVMTLGFGIKPPIARDFALMIQSVGMSAASFTILWTRIPIVGKAALFSSLGGAVGMVLGLEYVAPYVAPAYAKMLFTSVWLSFAFALFWINRYHEREVMRDIVAFGVRPAALLVAFGLIGGLVGSITGSGLDIVTFSLLVLRFRVDERIATPTSVVLMAGNAVVGALWRNVAQGGVSTEAWSFWWVCVPIVVVGAPFGAWFIKGRSRGFVAGLLYASIVAQFVAAVLIVPLHPSLIAFSVAVFACGVLLFARMARRGSQRLEWLAADRGDAWPSAGPLGCYRRDRRRGRRRPLQRRTAVRAHHIHGAQLAEVWLSRGRAPARPPPAGPRPRASAP